MRKLKYLLVPFTMILWFTLTYYSLSLTFMGMIYLFTINFWIIFFFFFILISLLYGITVSFPALLKMGIMWIYGKSKTISILHALAGLIGIINFIYMMLGFDLGGLIGSMWEESKLKFIMLFMPYIGMIFAVIWSNIITPFMYFYEP